MAGRSIVLAKLPLALFAALLFALVAGILVAATPGWLFERGVVAIGLPSAIPAATPPLGDKARIAGAIVAALLAGGIAGLVAHIALRRGKPVRKPTRPARGTRLDTQAIEMPAVVTGHRRPLFADAELGAPLMSEAAMAQARDELILEVPLEAEAPGAPVPVADEPGEEEAAAVSIAPEPVVAPEPVFQPAPDRVPAATLRPVAEEQLGTLMARLERALAAKPAGYVPPVGKGTALRRAWGLARS